MKIEHISQSERVNDVFQDALDKSEKQLKLMREIAQDVVGSNTGIIVGVNGSVARREATSGSDVDFFFLADENQIDLAKRLQSTFRSRLNDCGIKMPAHGGVFENPLDTAMLMKNIGGDEDTNEYLTRRMLFLLEGEWVHGQKEFADLRMCLIDHYVTDELEDRKLCRYLLNDIIRYWRTICVDFEEKTGAGGKPRAIRLIKLRFARMMLYFGGVAAISKTNDMPVKAKRELLLKMFASPPTKRVESVFGKAETAEPLAAYATFLNAINDKRVRDSLDQEGSAGLGTDEYKELVDVARQFRDGLEALLVDSQGLRNPISSALLL